MSAIEHDDAPLLRQHLLESRAEAESHRFDLGDATALIEALEAELWAVIACWRGPDRGRSASDAVSLLIQARTRIRGTMVQELASEQARAAALRDLRIAEAAFGFLLGLRSLRADRHRP